MAESDIRRGMEEAGRVLDALVGPLPGEVVALAARVADSLRAGGRLWLFGNGGSAAGAQHIACELVGRLRRGDERRALPATALTTDTSILTALTNDAGFDEVFARQVEAHVREGDVVIGLSTSGQSPNVLRGLVAAREQGALAVGLTGESEGELGGVCDVLLRVPSVDTPRIQEAQVLLGHLLCEEIERQLEG